MLRTKTYVSSEATTLCAELFALGGGRHYRRGTVAAAERLGHNLRTLTAS